jgi:hypothetical protein
MLGKGNENEIRYESLSEGGKTTEEGGMDDERGDILERDKQR